MKNEKKREKLAAKFENFGNFRTFKIYKENPYVAFTNTYEKLGFIKVYVAFTNTHE